MPLSKPPTLNRSVAPAADRRRACEATFRRAIHRDLSTVAAREHMIQPLVEFAAGATEAPKRFQEQALAAIRVVAAIDVDAAP
jgi:hypothetical protein